MKKLLVRLFNRAEFFVRSITKRIEAKKARAKQRALGYDFASRFLNEYEFGDSGVALQQLCEIANGNSQHDWRAGVYDAMKEHKIFLENRK